MLILLDLAPIIRFLCHSGHQGEARLVCERSLPKARSEREREKSVSRRKDETELPRAGSNAAAYQRSAELCRLRRGAILLAHLDQHLERSSIASLEFERVNGREPKAGDLLSNDDVARDQSAEFFAAFINAWNRRLPGLVCPLKLQDGLAYFRTLGDDSSEIWQQRTRAGTQARWSAVQRDAAGTESDTREDMPTVPGVRFLGVVYGRHRCTADSQARQA